MRAPIFIVIITTFLIISCNDKEDLYLKLAIATTNDISSFENTSNSVTLDIQIFPNPFDDFVIFRFPEASEAVIKISAFDGKVKEFLIESSNIAIDFSKESSGAYNCDIFLDNKVHKYTLIKK